MNSYYETIGQLHGRVNLSLIYIWANLQNTRAFCVESGLLELSLSKLRSNLLYFSLHAPWPLVNHDKLKYLFNGQHHLTCQNTQTFKLRHLSDLYICVCVYVRARVYVHVLVCICACVLHLHTRICCVWNACVCMRACCVHLCNTCICVCMCVAHARAHVCVCACACACVCACSIVHVSFFILRLLDVNNWYLLYK